jgi:hypothetical protein
MAITHSHNLSLPRHLQGILKLNKALEKVGCTVASRMNDKTTHVLMTAAFASRTNKEDEKFYNEKCTSYSNAEWVPPTQIASLLPMQQ